jgi:hypothetical protein
MSVIEPSASSHFSRTAAMEAKAASSRGIAQYTLVQRLIVGAGTIQSTIGLAGVVTLIVGIVLAFFCTVWAIQEGTPAPLAIMVGYCTLVGSAFLCAALLVIQNLAANAQPIGTKRRPNYAAWKLVSKLSVSDASHLWCDIEPGCPASQESIAWATAMLDAIRRGELPISARASANQTASNQEQVNPSWHTEITRDALKSWARSHGLSPRFLH